MSIEQKIEPSENISTPIYVEGNKMYWSRFVFKNSWISCLALIFNLNNPRRTVLYAKKIGCTWRDTTSHILFFFTNGCHGLRVRGPWLVHLASTMTSVFETVTFQNSTHFKRGSEPLGWVGPWLQVAPPFGKRHGIGLWATQTVTFQNSTHFTRHTKPLGRLASPRRSYSGRHTLQARREGPDGEGVLRWDWNGNR